MTLLIKNLEVKQTRVEGYIVSSILVEIDYNFYKGEKQTSTSEGAEPIIELEYITILSAYNDIGVRLIIDYSSYLLLEKKLDDGDLLSSEHEIEELCIANERSLTTWDGDIYE